MTETCYICGASAELVSETRPFRIGSREANVLQDFMRCPECGEEFLRPEQATENQRRAAQAIRVEEGLLAPERIRAIRERLSLSQEAFEKLLGVGPKTAVRWERGTVFQSRAADSLLRVVEALPEASRLLAELHDVQLESREEVPHEVSEQLMGRVRTVFSSYLEASEFQRAADILSETYWWRTSGVRVVLYQHAPGPWFSTGKTEERDARNRIAEGLVVG
ncbi:MAG: type II toxin-antitoxin system MqsA family antitoxin [Longimicrobiales bacterium]